MNSAALPSFWEAYENLNENIKARARRAFELWQENPFHPSLHFKCIHQVKRTWSVRITLDYRAIGMLEGNTVTWFWIGKHDEYERFFS